MRCLLLILLAACSSSASTPPEPTTVPPQVASTQTVSPGIELPEVSSTGFDRADQLVADIAVSPTALTIRGRELVALKDGRLSAHDVEGGAVGVVIPKLRDEAKSFAGKRVVLRIDRTVPFQTMAQVISSLARAGTNQLMLLARSGASQVGAPITLPATNQVGADEGLRLAVSVSSTELELWSMSGREGTLAEPKLAMKANPGIDLAQLGAALAEIRARSGNGDERSITILSDPTVPAQMILEVIGAVRATPEGATLYPDVVLGLIN